MKKIFFILFLFVWAGFGCGGSSKTQKGGSGASTSSGAPPPESSQPIPEYPIAKEAVKADYGIIKLNMKPYDHCAGGGCEEENDVETEEDRQRYSIPYRR